MGEIQQQSGKESGGKIYPSQTHDCRIWVNEIKKKLGTLGPPLSPYCCIYRVPKRLHDVNESAYDPQIVSIGPLHHGKDSLKKMENEKLRYLDDFLRELGSNVNGVLDGLVECIKNEETRIRECYADSIEYSSAEFVKMVLIDAVFIIQLFTMVVKGEKSRTDNDFTVVNGWQLSNIEQDLILLENQIPFFILKDIYDVASCHLLTGFGQSFPELALEYFDGYNNQKKEFPENIKHFTDLLWYFLLPSPKASSSQSQPQASSSQSPSKASSSQSPPKASPNHSQPQASSSQSSFPDCSQNLRRKPNKAKLIYNATKLYEGGVKFKAGKSNCMLDITFSNGYLEMPCFKLDYTTESFIRNIMALEVCHYRDETKICDYILLMDHLINTAKDVELLVKKKIMENWLGDHQAAAIMVNKLRFQIPKIEKNFYSDIFENLNAYYEVPRHSWRATLKHEYFRSPWRGASTIAAIVLLLLTALQTVFSGISL